MPLNAEEEKELQGLLASAKGENPVRFSWDENFQRRLLSLLLTDTYFLIQSQSLVKPTYFTNESHVLACEVLFELFAKYKSIPEKFILVQGVQDKLKDRDDSVKLAFVGEVESVYDYYVPGISTREVLLDRLTMFSRAQSTRIACKKVEKMILEKPDEEKTWLEVDEMLRNTLLVQRGMDVGFEFFMSIDEMFRRMKEQQESGEKFTTGLDWIDRRLSGGTPKRGELYAWIGLPGRGKSLLLAQAATENVKLGHRVCYISLEMDDVEVAKRITSQLTCNDINFLWDNRDSIKEEIDLRNKNLQEGGGEPNNLIIRQYPGGTVDVNFVRAYVAHLKLYGFKPDVLIIDYAGEFKEPADIPSWEAKYRIMRDLRAMAIMEGMVVYTAVQPNKSAAELTEINQYIDESNIGGSFDQFKPLDGFWSINQLKQEKDANVGRVFIIKHRSGKSQEAVDVEFDYGTMRISQIDRQRYNKLLQSKADETAQEIDSNSAKLNQGSKGGKKKKGLEPFHPNNTDKMESETCNYESPAHGKPPETAPAEEQ
jgi:replicative DNA helicase